MSEPVSDAEIINELRRQNLNDIQARVRLAREVEQLRQTVQDQSDEIANCKILKYEAVLDDMEEFCSVRPDIDGDDPVTCGWRNAIYRMREIRRG